MQGSTENKCRRILLAELAQARELIIQLESHFDENSLPELCKTLPPMILSLIDKLIYMAKSFVPEKQNASSTVVGDLPQLFSNSPCGENENSVHCKKRKTLSTWTQQVRLGAIEGPVDDGYSWRKYGQKDILGAKHPRGYYRCTHRNTQGCPATKQVQRSDDDPQVFDVTYHGVHTCLSRDQPSVGLARRGNLQRQNLEGLQKQRDGLYSQDLLLSFKTGLQVKTEGLNCDTERNNSVPFASGASPALGILPDNVFSSPCTPENRLVRSPCPSLFSPTTSELTYFSVSPRGMSSLEVERKLQPSEIDIFEMIISTPKSSCSSTVVDNDFEFDFDMDFNLEQCDTSSFFL